MADRFTDSDNTFYNGYNHVAHVDGRVHETNTQNHRPASNHNPQLDAQLERMIFPDASFGPFALLSEHHDLSHLPHGDIAYVQNGSATQQQQQQQPLRDRASRAKVSKACDDCRRKKTRCDATEDSGNATCTPCARAGLKCTFNRQQLKRGPSKGYIKDLSERLQHLEQQIQDPTGQPQGPQEQRRQGRANGDGLPAEKRRGQTAVYVDGQHYVLQQNSVPEARTGEKRSHAAIEDFSPHSSWDGTSITQSPSYPISNLSPPSVRNHQPFWRMSANNDDDAIAIPYEQNSAEPILAANVTFDWDEDVVGEYYRLIHQTFPILPNSKTRLKYRLADCSASLRDACLAALDCLTRTFPTSSLSPTPSYHMTLKKAAENLAKYPFDNPSSHTPATNLLYLQTLLLMAIETDNHGPATIRGQAGPSRAEWLGRAAAVAAQLEINTATSTFTNANLLAGDRDSEDRLARRVWWVLFILDRWHASSTADLLKLPENSVVLLPEDQILLGESTYHLARLSFIIGHLAAILTTIKTPSSDVMSPSNPASSLLTLTLAGEVDRFRESVESVWGSLNLVHLSYHHVHLLIKRLNPISEPAEMVGHAHRMATVLNSRATPLTPLNHHFAALSAMTLCELANVRETRDQAIRGLEELRSCLGGGRGLAGFEGSEGWDGAVRDLVVKKLDRIEQSIESDAGAGQGGEEAKYDPTTLTRYGYLTALAQGTVKIR